MSGTGSAAATPNSEAAPAGPASDDDYVDWGRQEEGEERQEGAGDDDEGQSQRQPQQRADQQQDGEDDQAAGEDDAGDDQGQGGEGGEDQGSGDDDPPEFWSADRKALWAKIADPEVRAAIKGHVEEVSRGTARKLEESATKVRQAEESARGAIGNQEQLAAWWKANGPSIQRLVMGRWADVDWNKLSADDPAGYVQAQQQMNSELGQLRALNERHQAEIKKVEDRQKADHQRERAAEHAKLAAKYPKEFGGEGAQKTYDALSKFLIDTYGIAPQRLSGIYEQSVVEVVRDAYKYRQLQKKAKGITSPQQSGAPASTTPKRVVPGAPRSANQQPNAERQAVEKLRKGERLTDEEAGLAFR